MKEGKKQRGIFERPPGSGVWWISYFDATGWRRREKAGTKSAALALYRKRKVEALQGRKLPEKLRRREVLVSELIEDAESYSRDHHRSHADYVCRLGRLKQWFGQQAAELLTAQDIEHQFAQVAEAENLAPATLNRYRAVGSLAYRLGIRNAKVTTNPFRLVQHRLEHNARVRYLTAEEEERLRKVIVENYAEHLAEFDLALNTGLRQGSQFSLTWREVDLVRQVLTVRVSKSGKPQHLPLNRSAFKVLLTLKQLSNGTERIFSICKPRWFEAAVKDAAIPDFTWHDLRHTFASRLVMAGVDLRTVQELMGHGSIQMTCRYAHLAPTYLREAVERLDEKPSGTRSGTEPSDTAEQPLAYVQ